MVVLAVHTHHDDLLGLVAPLAIASARSTALVVDLDRDGLTLPGERTLADLVADGPTLAELVPHRSGIACLPNGGVDPEAAQDVLAALEKGWPDLIVRTRGPIDRLPVANVVPMLAGVSAPTGPCVWVRTGLGPVDRHQGPEVRAPGRAAFAAALAGRALRGRWLQSWSGVWEWPWP